MSDVGKNTVLISIVSPDQVGLIAAITGRLFDLGLNLADTSFSILGQGCEFSCVAEAPDHISSRTIMGELKSLEPMQDAEILVSDYRYHADQGENATATHTIEVYGGDQPGLVARLAEVFIDYDANVVRMNSTRRPDDQNPEGPGVYITRFDISVASAREEGCLSAVANTAGALQLQCRHFAKE